MNEVTLREHVFTVLMARISHDDERRNEALNEVIELTVPDIKITAAHDIAHQIPPLPPSLYKKWINLFWEKLKTTTPKEQLVEICSGNVDNNSVLALVFIMFMESERMEKVITKDLQDLGHSLSETDVAGTTLGTWLRHKMTPKKAPS